MEQKGEVHIGEAAWQHLDAMAGSTMTIFLQKYVRSPIQAMLAEVPAQLPELVARMDDGGIELSIHGEIIRIRRAAVGANSDPEASFPEDIDDQMPGQ